MIVVDVIDRRKSSDDDGSLQYIDVPGKASGMGAIQTTAMLSLFSLFPSSAMADVVEAGAGRTSCSSMKTSHMFLVQKLRRSSSSPGASQLKTRSSSSSGSFHSCGRLTSFGGNSSILVASENDEHAAADVSLSASRSEQPRWVDWTDVRMFDVLPGRIGSYPARGSGGGRAERIPTSCLEHRCLMTG